MSAISWLLTVLIRDVEITDLKMANIYDIYEFRHHYHHHHYHHHHQQQQCVYTAPARDGASFVQVYLYGNWLCYGIVTVL